MELKFLGNIDRNELSTVEVIYAILLEKGDVLEFNELLELVQEYLGWSDKKLEESMVRIYTDINVDGRFISLGENRWGLRAWYPIDSIDEEIISSIDDDEIPETHQPTIDLFGDEGGLIDYSGDDPEDRDLYEDEDDYNYDPNLNRAEDDDEDDDGLGELVEYADDLEELGDDDLDLDDDSGDFGDDNDDEDYDEDEDFDDF